LTLTGCILLLSANLRGLRRAIKHQLPYQNRLSACYP
jgi:hypothetical protein